MSQVNISRNVFLEKEEINRINKFSGEEGVTEFIKNVTKSGGIVSSSISDIGDNFLIEKGSDHRHIKFSQSSVAYDKLGRRINYILQSSLDIALPYTVGASKATWVSIEYGQTHIEEGTVTLSSNGLLTGVDTSFTEVFRGISTLVPNKIRIYSRTKITTGGTGYSYINVGTYEITQVTNDTSLLINATNSLVAGDYVYSVVGAFSPGTYDDAREDEIYTHDYFNLIYSTSLPTLTENQYIIAKVTVNDLASTQTIDDLREDIFQVLDPEFIDFMFETNNSITEGYGGRKEAIIINDCVATIDVNASPDTFAISSGKVKIGDIIYQTLTQTFEYIVAQNLYWKLYDNAGVTYARVVQGATKLATYYTYNQNHRLNSRRYSAILSSALSIYNESGYYEGDFSVEKRPATTGQYWFNITGICPSYLTSNYIQTAATWGDARGERDFTVSVRSLGTQSLKCTPILYNSSLNSVLGFTVANGSTGAAEDLNADFEVIIEKISKDI